MITKTFGTENEGQAQVIMSQGVVLS